MSPFLFAIFIDEFTKGIQDEVPWYMLFADDIILIDVNRKDLTPSWSDRDKPLNLGDLDSSNPRLNT